MLKLASFAIGLVLAMGALGLAEPVLAQSSPAPATPSPSPTPTTMPIKVGNCAFLFENTDSGTPLLVYLSFLNDSGKIATDVRFRFMLQNSYDQYVTNMPTGEVHGKFSPGILIEPAHAFNGTPIPSGATFPSSPAWEIYNPLGKDLRTVTCIPDTARFEDGTTWSSQ